MKKIFLLLPALVLVSFTPVVVLKENGTPNIIFALLEGGKKIEPVALVGDGKLTPAIEGTEAPDFAALYYKTGKVYRVCAGGKLTGSATVIKNNLDAECGNIMADVKTLSPAIKPGSNEMLLATDLKPAKAASGTRRSLTATEKVAIEKLAKETFHKKIILTKELKAVKLTALDVDNDKVPEITGTYICSPKLGERAVLFFIAAKDKSGAYIFQYSSVTEFREDELMSQEIQSIDEGVYVEKLLDVLDTDNSGVAKVFTITPSFEGTGFTIYSRKGTEWEKSLEISNYHCAY